MNENNSNTIKVRVTRKVGVGWFVCLFVCLFVGGLVCDSKVGLNTIGCSIIKLHAWVYYIACGAISCRGMPMPVLGLVKAMWFRIWDSVGCDQGVKA